MEPYTQVKTSKYTLVTFVPRNLLEQFRRVANVFFLSKLPAYARIDSIVF